MPGEAAEASSEIQTATATSVPVATESDLDAAREAGRKGLAAPIFQRLRDEPDYQPLVAAFPSDCAGLDEYRAEFRQRGLDPGGLERAIQQLEGEAEQLTDPSQIEEKALRIASLRGITGHVVQARIDDKRVVAALRPVESRVVLHVTRLVGLKVQGLRVQARAILDIAEVNLTAYLGEARADERAYFESRGVPTEATAISRRVEAALLRVARMREAIEENPRIHPWSQPVWTLDFRGILGDLVQ